MALLTETREELIRADNKAAILLAAAGIVSGATISAVLAGQWTPYDLPPMLLCCWWLACLLFVYAIFALGSALFPSIERHGNKPKFIGYFGDVVAAFEHGDLEAALERTQRDLLDRNLDQLLQISRIVVRKYLRIRRALQALAGSLLLLIIIAISWSLFFQS